MGGRSLLEQAEAKVEHWLLTARRGGGNLKGFLPPSLYNSPSITRPRTGVVPLRGLFVEP